MSKYGGIIEEARKKPESKKTRKPAKKKVVDKAVNLSIKVPESLRRHWVSEAKKEGSTITAEITQLLNKKYGKP